jgi:predicted PurR-regulated permease PerM
MENLVKHEKHIVAISVRSIALFTLIPLGLFFLWLIRDLIFSLLIGFILMSALRPAVVFFTKYKFPRTAAIIFVYLVFVLFFIALISLIVPPIVIETSILLRSLPGILEDLSPQLGRYVDLSDLTRFVPNVTNNILGFIGSVFSNTLFIVTTLFFGFYFLLEENLLDSFLKRYFHESTVKRVTSVLSIAEKRMSSWFWGELTLMTVVGLLTFIGLNIIGMRYALPLAVLAGLLEVVPNIGPVISSIPAIILGFSSSPVAGFVAMSLYVIVQQLENNLIVPIIMKKAVGVNPILTLIALILGGRIGGVLGVLLAIPLLLFTETIIAELLHGGDDSVKDRK